jgi:hypothetical protein
MTASPGNNWYRSRWRGGPGMLGLSLRVGANDPGRK